MINSPQLKMVSIQAQDLSGNWRTYNVMSNDDPQRMLGLMQQLQRQFPRYRVRAVDQNGMLLNLI